LLALALFISSFGVVAYRMDIYTVLRQEGVSAAVARLNVSGSADDRERYQAAWVHFRNHDLDYAEQLANQLLDAAQSEKMEADCRYLLAHISRTRGDYNAALDLLYEAKSLYLLGGRDQAVFLCNVELARNYWLLNQPVAGEQYISRAEAGLSHVSEAGDISLYHWVATRIVYSRGDLDMALAHAHKAVEYSERAKNRELLATSYSELGFLLALSGQMESGRTWTFRAQELITRLGDPRLHVYNSVNFILLQRCSGQEPDPYLLDSIRSFIERPSSKDLAFFLDKALNHPCIGGNP
jgi:tetratricopeptide (TPR) repeat protein